MDAERGDFAPGMTLGTHRLERLLGRGGMGAVFLAYDTRLHRQVAVKVITSEAQDGTSSARLLREARNAAALNHPHICTIHEIGEAGGTAFIAMEYVDGRSLREQIDEGALPVGEAVRLGIQAGDALAYAHEHGVVHRDFKAANVIVGNGGRLKVVDFGLARRDDPRLAEATTMPSLVLAGAAAGTPYAMAPEQVRAEAADARTDVWALGVLVYEMVTGARPFKGQTVPELFSSILEKPPAVLPSTVPTALCAVIERCLEKDPQRRYQRAQDVRVSLEAIEAGTVAPWVTWRYHLRRRPILVSAASFVVVAMLVGLNVGGVRDGLLGVAPDEAPIKLAVLPFQNLTGDPDQEYFSDGLTDEMITHLGRLQPGRLSVIARTSSMRYKRRDVPIEQIGNELGVDYVVEGSARREGSRVRINATLIQVRGQTQRWTDSFDREFASILALQSEIARGVAGALALTLLPAEERRLAAAPPVVPEAYEAYVKGMQHFYRLTPQDLETAKQYFELALRHDPKYAAAHGGIASVWAGRQQMGFVPPSEATPKAIDAAERAVKLDSSVAEAYWAVAMVRFVEWNWTDCERALQRVIDLRPNDSNARALYSHVLNMLKRPREARDQIDRALAVDPYNGFLRGFNGVDLFFERKWDEAINELRSALQMSPGLPFAAKVLVSSFHMKRSYSEALDALEVYAGIMTYTEVEQVLRRRGRDQYRQIMRDTADALAARSRNSYVSHMDIVTYYTYAGEHARAIEWLEKALDIRDPSLPYVGQHDLDPLRDDPRYKTVLQRVNLPAD